MTKNVILLSQGRFHQILTTEVLCSTCVDVPIFLAGTEMRASFSFLKLTCCAGRDLHHLADRRNPSHMLIFVTVLDMLVLLSSDSPITLAGHWAVSVVTCRVKRPWLYRLLASTLFREFLQMCRLQALRTPNWAILGSNEFYWIKQTVSILLHTRPTELKKYV